MHPVGVNFVNKQGTRSKRSWQTCSGCGIKTRSLRWGKKFGGFVCYNCYIKDFHIIGIGKRTRKKRSYNIYNEAMSILRNRHKKEFEKIKNKLKKELKKQDDKKV